MRKCPPKRIDEGACELTGDCRVVIQLAEECYKVLQEEFVVILDALEFRIEEAEEGFDVLEAHFAEI